MIAEREIKAVVVRLVTPTEFCINFLDDDGNVTGGSERELVYKLSGSRIKELLDKENKLRRDLKIMAQEGLF
ncbi:hypothetical protein [Campylobacter mucosalis]|uniref:Uncharacterized protein n=1 Tax=Campylobacter mucosalis CCUG 21559 TaxID=1032067 RepID=A0A6G5QEW1_9BACT|nr:hypothetical protein [Campylobacter mucosalis]QCD44107.1 hypothetical protein CMUC_0293 [Campylobacter mucosalis CCUG 21559]QCD44696.1 hypothetical protein CMUC_0907 [Campylobacter mucosalis CCUG 21559]